MLFRSQLGCLVVVCGLPACFGSMDANTGGAARSSGDMMQQQDTGAQPVRKDMGGFLSDFGGTDMRASGDMKDVIADLPVMPDGGVPDMGAVDIGAPFELKAFPSAYGAGAYATGGRGGTVYHVTHLRDDGSEGSLRWALGQPRPAMIVFDVSGTINLESWLTLSGRDVTIAGQTAPVGGITLTSTSKARVRGQDIENFIVRYIRLRPLESGDDAFEFYGNREGALNIIMDHISASYGGDETMSLRGAQTHHVTYQRCLIAEGKTGSLFGDSSSPEFSEDNSFLNSLFWNISHRTPNTASNGRVDIINNVIQNWQYRLTYAHGDTQLNHIGNYYAMGERSSLGSSQIQLNAVNSSFEHSIYTAANRIDKGVFEEPDADNRELWVEFESGRQTVMAPFSEFTDVPYPLLGPAMQIKSAQQAYADVIDDVGANASLEADGSVTFYTDANDTDYLAVMRQGEGAYEAYEMYADVRSWFGESRYAAFVASISDVPIHARPAGYDTDRDGMPDVWEQATFGDLSRDGSDDLDGNGYTDLEEFLNRVDIPR